MRITNPDWHPAAPSQLTVAQRENLRRLGRMNGVPVLPRDGRDRKSLDSLVRHNLARRLIDREKCRYVITELGRRWYDDFLAGHL